MLLVGVTLVTDNVSTIFSGISKNYEILKTQTFVINILFFNIFSSSTYKHIDLKYDQYDTM